MHRDLPLIVARRAARRWGLAVLAGAAALGVLGAWPVEPAHATEAPDQIVVVTIDGLPVGSDRSPAVMPALTALADRGVRIAAAWSPSPLPFPAVVALLTGSGPGVTGVNDEATRGVAEHAPALAAVLSRRGFHTLALPGDALCHAASGLEHGFDRYSPRAPALPESARVDTALAWLAAGGRRFAWIGFTLGAPPEPWRRMDGIGPRAPAAFEARRRAVDRALARLLAGLDRTAPGSRAVVVVAGTGAQPGALDGTDAAPNGRCGVPLVFSRALDPRATTAHLDARPLPTTRVAPLLAALVGAPAASFAPARHAGPAAAPDAGSCDADLARTLGGEGGATAAAQRWRELIALLPAVENPVDSAGAERLQRLSEASPQARRIALEWALARSFRGQETLVSRDLKAMVATAADYPEAAIAYSDHLLRFRHPELMEAALAAVPPGGPLAALAEWRRVVAIAARQDFGAAAVAAERASRLMVPNPALLAAADSLRAMAALRDRARARPTDPTARLDYARALGDFGLHDAAFQELHAARALSPWSGEPDFRIATLLLRQNRLEPAIATLRRALKTEPGHRAARAALADALLQAGHRHEARIELEQLLSDNPGDARGQFNLACLLATEGEREAALGALERAIDRGYDDWDEVERDPDLAGLRDDPRYRSLLERRR